MAESVDCVVVGAGVVGLAAARALAIAGNEVVILEQHAAIGTETSSRNSEVIHAGLYYPRGSRKARLCVRGRALLYAYCERNGLPHRRCGKLVVATNDSQLPELARIDAAARENGVSDLQFLERRAARSMEPGLECVGALLSPSTGIIDSHAFMVSLLGEAERHGAVIVYRSRALVMRPVHGRVELSTGGEAPSLLRTRWVINSAGLGAVTLAKCIKGFPIEHIPREYRAKGSYFALAGRAPFSHLIYPAPEPGGLGVHLTLDLAGQARFGPDVEWVESMDYEVDPGRAQRFYEVIRRYWPDLADGALVPAYAGIRPKIVGPGEPASDFRIDGPATHAVPGIVNLFGIESPGLTASLAIAEEVVAIVGAAA
jgi:L-2-hydroxyglutarate oxidase LhgO